MLVNYLNNHSSKGTVWLPGVYKYSYSQMKVNNLLKHRWPASLVMLIYSSSFFAISLKEQYD